MNAYCLITDAVMIVSILQEVTIVPVKMDTT